MRIRQEIVVAIVGGVMVVGILAVLFTSHRQAFFPGVSLTDQAVKALRPNPNGLNIPTIDQMCAAAGATAANMKDCQNDEQAAGEFVVAWMTYNGFVANGAIDIEQIQQAASLDDNGLAGSAVGGGDPTFGADLSLGGDPSLTGDPSLGGAEPNIDPATGEAVDQNFQSPAQIAIFCMSSSNDWLKMHDCISRYDPSSRFGGN